jgi:hypothetical protein
MERVRVRVKGRVRVRVKVRVRVRVRVREQGSQGSESPLLSPSHFSVLRLPL